MTAYNVSLARYSLMRVSARPWELRVPLFDWHLYGSEHYHEEKMAACGGITEARSHDMMACHMINSTTLVLC